MGKYTPLFSSLTAYECPDWFRDAKFGIWSHWGPQSVPMLGDWYARQMYIQGSRQYLHHLRHYGHPSQFGYKDVCALWKAENFNPDELMKLYVESGAKYFVAQAMHHDHFFNYDSDLNRFNSVKVGPKKDICGLWKQAADKYQLPFGLSEHLGASFSWWRVNKHADTYGPYAGIPYDGNDPAYRDFYHDNYEHVSSDHNDSLDPWYTTNVKFREYWLSVMKEIIDKYQPDLLYTDGALPFDGKDTSDQNFKYGLEAVSYLYNKSIENYGENRAVYTQKDRRPEIYKVGVLDIEKSQLPDIMEYPWHTDTCIGNWFYDATQPFKKPGHIIEMLVDIISKNGTMLLNVLQRPDGTIDEEAKFILKEIGGWFKTCGEGVYGTRPWRVYGEGDSRVLIKGFSEEAVKWNSSDLRFTQKDGILYAFMMKTPDNRVAVIKSLADEQVSEVRLLGAGTVEFAQNFGILSVKLPENLPSEYTNCLAIKLEK